MRLIDPGVELKGEIAFQLADLLIRQDGEQLIGVRLSVEGIALFAQCAGKLLRRIVGVTRKRQPEVVLQERQKLHAEQPPLGEHAAALLDGIAEVGMEVLVDQHQNLTEQQAVLRAADVKCVAEAREILRLKVVFLAHERGAHTRAVQIEVQPQLAARRGERFQLGPGVDRAKLGRIGDIDHFRHDHVPVVAIVVRGNNAADILRRQLAVRRRNNADLVAGRLDGGRFMHGDVRRFGGDDSLPRAERRCDERQIGDRAAQHEMHVRLRAGKAAADSLNGLRTVGVAAVADGRLQIRCGQGVENRGMCALGIVVSEKVHGRLPHFLCFLHCTGSVFDFQGAIVTRWLAIVTALIVHYSCIQLVSACLF